MTGTATLAQLPVGMIRILTPLGRAQVDVDWLTELSEGLKDDTRTWRDWREDFTCADRTEAAKEEVWHALLLAREELARLERSGGTR